MLSGRGHVEFWDRLPGTPFEGSDRTPNWDGLSGHGLGLVEVSNEGALRDAHHLGDPADAVALVEEHLGEVEIDITARASAVLAQGLRPRHSGPDTFDDQCLLELRDGGKEGEDHLAGGRAGVHGFPDGK